LTNELIFSESRCKKTLKNQGFNYTNWWSWGESNPRPQILYR